jgi:hypothetical protein
LRTGAKAKPCAPEIEARAGESLSRTLGGHRPLMEAVVESENLNKALARVKHDKGVAGIDGISGNDLRARVGPRFGPDNKIATGAAVEIPTTSGDHDQYL